MTRHPFCAQCGTPLGLAFLADAENVSITVGSFDDLSHLRPTHHYAADNRYKAWIETRDLPRTRRD
ncbi:hypothetical protein F1C10_03585 [Sphingomonas sp. NBWT7]|nr:hypothetical protein F1C10_03585 [Sphingomonas sp. NBWT7]